MSQIPSDFQPGQILHSAIVGAFKARGITFQDWCVKNGVTQSSARNVTYGQMAGPKGRAMLMKMIDDAGRDIVTAAYANRVIEEAQRVAK